jgi:hypothetical protein
MSQDAHPLDRIEALVTQAEQHKAPEPFLSDARELLAREALAGNKHDTERLTALVKRCSENSGDHTTPERLIPWGNFLGCVADFLQEGIVAMRDGRVATSDGWNYSNCQPDDLHCNLSRAQSERLQAYVATLTDAEASPDPERNPSEYDEKFDEAVEEAITAFLNSKGFPQP